MTEKLRQEMEEQRRKNELLKKERQQTIRQISKIVKQKSEKIPEYNSKTESVGDLALKLRIFNEHWNKAYFNFNDLLDVQNGYILGDYTKECATFTEEVEILKTNMKCILNATFDVLAVIDKTEQLLGVADETDK